MKPPRMQLPSGSVAAGAPLLVLADANVSVGVIGLVIAILVVVAVLVAIIAIETLGEHRDNERAHWHH